MSSGALRDPVLALAFRKIGDSAACARALGVSKQAVHQWRRAPQGRLLQLARVSGVPAAALRPDLADWIEAQGETERQAQRAAARERFTLIKAAADRRLPPPKGLSADDYAEGVLTAVAACRFVAEARGLAFAAVCAGARREDLAARAHAMALAHVVGRAGSSAIGALFGVTRQNVDNVSERYLRARDGDDPDDFIGVGADGKPRVIERGRVRRAKDAAEALWTLETEFAARLAGDAETERKRA